METQKIAVRSGKIFSEDQSGVSARESECKWKKTLVEAIKYYS